MARQALQLLVAEMSAYYNEFDPGAAAWLRELIKQGLIADGEVDNRSILDVRPVDIAGFTQCHFFAGVGGWSYALRLAGWPDDRPVWTGSPPCQPFSTAGRNLGRDDERHLAPHFVDLVRACRPPMLFGEQVASAAVFGGIAKGGRNSVAEPPQWAWIDDLSDRLEAARYAVGAVDLPAAGVGAPHIRQRTFFGAVRLGNTASGWQRPRVADDGRRGQHERQDRAAGDAGGLADAEGAGSPHGRSGSIQPVSAVSGGADGWLADADGLGRSTRARGDVERQSGVGSQSGSGQGQDARRDGDQGCGREADWTAARQHPSADHGGWADADWLFCRDGKWRPVEPGTFPLAHGVSARVGQLRGYGNAIVPQAAAEVIKAFIGVLR